MEEKNCDTCLYKVFANENLKNKENEYNIIEITLESGASAIWEADKGEWDDYEWRDQFFIIKKNGVWVGFYNIKKIVSVVVK